MGKLFVTIEMLPVTNGDALVVEYGRGGPTRRMVVDGGPIETYPALRERLGRLPAGEQRVELVAITHVDTDHIEGIIRVLAEPRAKWPIEPKEIWFNGWRHMEEGRDLGGLEGEYLSALLRDRAFPEWNVSFGGQAVMTRPAVPLPEVSLADGMTLTLLSPSAADLGRMSKKWAKDLDGKLVAPGDLDAAWEKLVEAPQYAGAGLLGPEDFSAKLKQQLGKDSSAANRSSIAFLAELRPEPDTKAKAKRVLFLADAHMKTVCESLERLVPEAKRPLVVDAVKVSHHGSRGNISQKFFELVDAEHFLISTNGDTHDHPHKEAVESILVGARRPPTLWFNYRVPTTERWEKKAGKKYAVRFPKAGTEGMRVPL